MINKMRRLRFSNAVLAEDHVHRCPRRRCPGAVGLIQILTRTLVVVAALRINDAAHVETTGWADDVRRQRGAALGANGEILCFQAVVSATFSGT